MFESLIFLPLDLPKLEFNREILLTWYDRNKTRGYEEYVKSIGYPWNVIWLRDLDKNLEWRDDLDQVFPNLQQVLAHLPHETIRKMYVLEQVIDVEPHRDVSREDDPELGPSTYRAMLINDYSKTLYYLRGAETDPGESPLYPKFPEPGMWFVHNNFSSRHGAKMPPAGARKLILCVWGRVDKQKHIELVGRSYTHYGNWGLV